MKEKWTTNPETRKENDSLMFHQIKNAISEILSKQIRGSKPEDVSAAAWMVLANLATEFRTVPQDFLDL